MPTGAAQATSPRCVRRCDTTGSGDAVTAAVIFGLPHEMPIDEAVRLGVSAAALTLRTRHTVAPDLSLIDSTTS